MLCEKCSKNEATVYWKTTVNGHTGEHHLCAACAQQTDAAKLLHNPFSGFDSLFTTLDHALTGTLSESAMLRGQRTADVCSVCGASSGEIMRTGRPGCAECYTRFAAILNPIIRRIHGNVRYSGAVPASAGEQLQRKRRLDELKNQLSEAVRTQEFEQAAKIRDEIRSMEEAQ